ncbi:MAG TPA: sulfatase-like hydrolase/transferase [Phycisphaerae bacterium]|nr:sulfatase-like hydrolase/transferase [Phycisphaerae bacterium]
MTSIIAKMTRDHDGKRLSRSIGSAGRLGGVLLLGLLSASLWAAEQSRSGPNLLFIWTDEQRADTMAAYGNTKIHAPNLDKLASESIVFRNAYVTQPVCTPSRSSVMTGLWPHNSGCTTNNVPLPRQVLCLPELVGDRGYRTAYMGKWHLGDEIFPQHGFEQMVSIEDGYARYYGPGRDRTQRSDYHRFLLSKGYKPNQKDGTFGREFASRLPIEHCKPKFLETRACEFLRRHRDEPFILYVNFLEPHMPFFGPLDREHRLDEVFLPANFSDPLEDNEPLRYRLMGEYCARVYGRDEAAFKELTRKYWGLVTQVDRSIGEILKALDELKLSDKTIVVFTSDHGDMMGSHKLVTKTLMYEESVRVPWLMRVPELGRQQRMITSPVSHIDLVPTLLDLMGMRVPDGLAGYSLVPLMRGGKAAEDHVFMEWNPGTGVHVVEGGSKIASQAEIDRIREARIRTIVSPDGWKLCLSDTDRSQLFNLRDDPGETRNLFDSGRHEDVIVRLTERIRRWQQKTGDTMKLPDGR